MNQQSLRNMRGQIMNLNAADLSLPAWKHLQNNSNSFWSTWRRKQCPTRRIRCMRVCIMIWVMVLLLHCCKFMRRKNVLTSTCCIKLSIGVITTFTVGIIPLGMQTRAWWTNSWKWSPLLALCRINFIGRPSLTAPDSDLLCFATLRFLYCMIQPYLMCIENLLVRGQ